ncbi:hypothetical protein B7P43_G04271 [Cryptotermes secundus]|uniref:Mos1 transposase HTH domain-containing protein n=1 Tax=Cryptotermes secundus TaxID=105785 RepID=A0A2J7PWA7_9NEOP|nr:hypothetical protein B7P43_G04271 [Cryptotermes secundus]
MADLREQHVCIKFCFKLGKTATGTHQMLKQAFGENSLGQTQTYNWYKRFKDTLGLSYGTCQRILSEELNMRRIAAKFVPRLLQNEQKQHRLEVCRELQQQLQEDPNFLSKVVTGDKNLAPCDFFLFPKMKIKLKGRRFDTVEEIQAETQTVLNTLTKKGFQDAFEKWQKRWDQCMRSQGDYFEGDGAE